MGFDFHIDTTPSARGRARAGGHCSPREQGGRPDPHGDDGDKSRRAAGKSRLTRETSC